MPSMWKGHLKALCRSKPKPGSAHRRRGQHRNVRQVQEEEDNFTDKELPLHRIGLRKDTQPLKVSTESQ